MARPRFFYDNRFADATPVASSTAAGDFSVLNVREWRDYRKWKPTSLPATITVNCGSAKYVDSVVIWSHDLYTNGCTVEVRGSTDNFGASDVLVHSYTPTSDAPIVRVFTPAQYQYWRVRITGSTAPTIGICAIGNVLEIPAGIDSGFDPIGRKIVGDYNRSETGRPLGRNIVFQEWGEKLRFSHLTWAWVRASWLPAWEAHLNRNPFVFAWEMDTYPDEVRLVTAKTNFSAPHTFGGLTALEVEVMGALYV